MLYVIYLLTTLLLIAILLIWQLYKEKNQLLYELHSSNHKCSEYENKLNIDNRLSYITSRLGIIDQLSHNVQDLQRIFNTKNQRGAFGENKLLDILRDELPASYYSSQYILNNNTRPDTVIYLPCEPSIICIDAKFPLENFSSILSAQAIQDKIKVDLAKKAFIIDMKKHIKDVSQKYILLEQTQDMAILFIPAESIFSYICEECPQLQLFAAQNKVILCTPNTLMLVLNIIKSLIRDQEMQKNAREIKAEVLKLTADLNKIADTNDKILKHFHKTISELETMYKLTNKANNFINKIANSDSIKLNDFTYK